MTKAAWWHLYKIAIPDLILILVLRRYGWDSSLLHWWLYASISLSIVIQVLDLVLLSYGTHRHSGRCHICLLKPDGWK